MSGTKKGGHPWVANSECFLCRSLTKVFLEIFLPALVSSFIRVLAFVLSLTVTILIKFLIAIEESLNDYPIIS